MSLETQAGHPYDSRAIERDVRHLWSMSRFEDVRVEATPDGAVVFHLVEARAQRLHQLHVEPSTAEVKLKLLEGMPMSRMRAHEVALDAQRQLNASGYANARVDYELIPYATHQADLRLTIDKGKPERVREVDFIGGPMIARDELRRSLDALHTRRIVFWRLHPSYSAEAMDADAARVRSLYLLRGYLDAEVRAEHLDNERVSFVIEPGPLYSDAPDGRELCSGLLQQRREAERRGVLDFKATLNSDMSVQVDRGPSYRIGRIEFSGNHHVSQSTLRRTLLLDEGDLLDERLLRLSVDRLNRMQLFEPIHVSDVVLRTDERTGSADVMFPLTERKRGAWRLSGPVGPPSFAGSLQASISARLPSWGRGVFELSTYSASISMYAFAGSLLPSWAIASRQSLLPVLALHRPFTPVSGWMSGWTAAPQFGWRATALSYATVQTQQRTLPLLAGNRGMEAELVIEVRRPTGDVQMFCAPPAPRFMALRRAASIGIEFLGVFGSL